MRFERLIVRVAQALKQQPVLGVVPSRWPQSQAHYAVCKPHKAVQIGLRAASQTCNCIDDDAVRQLCRESQVPEQLQEAQR